MPYARAAMTEDDTPRSKGGRPRKSAQPLATFLVKMDQDIRAFFDDLLTKAKAEARRTGAPIPSVNDLIKSALREWSERHPAWTDFNKRKVVSIKSKP